MDRREFMKGLFAAATVTAEELWVPTKLISIPSGKVFTGGCPFSIDEQGNITIHPQNDDKVTVLQLHRWLQEEADKNAMNTGHILDITNPNPSMRVTDQIIELHDGYRVVNPEYLSGGSLKQENELWANITSVGHVEPNSVALINGKPAIRPGHLDQCVKVEPGEEVVTSLRTPGNTYAEFKVKANIGCNYSALAETRDLCYHNPMADPAYEVYSKYGSDHPMTTSSKGMRLGLQEYERNLRTRNG